MFSREILNDVEKAISDRPVLAGPTFNLLLSGHKLFCRGVYVNTDGCDVIYKITDLMINHGLLTADWNTIWSRLALLHAKGKI